MYEGVQPGAMDYSAVVQKLRSEGADVLIFGGNFRKASKLLALMNKKKIKLPFIGSDGLKSDGFPKIAGKDAEGVYVTGPKDVSRLPINSKARSDYKAKYGKEPGIFFDQAVAATTAVLNAVKIAGGTDYDALSRALKSSVVDTAIGKIKFDAKGDAEGVRFFALPSQERYFRRGQVGVAVPINRQAEGGVGRLRLLARRAAPSVLCRSCLLCRNQQRLSHGSSVFV